MSNPDGAVFDTFIYNLTLDISRIELFWPFCHPFPDIIILESNVQNKQQTIFLREVRQNFLTADNKEGGQRVVEGGRGFRAQLTASVTARSQALYRLEPEPNVTKCFLLQLLVQFLRQMMNKF